MVVEDSELVDELSTGMIVMGTGGSVVPARAFFANLHVVSLSLTIYTMITYSAQPPSRRNGPAALRAARHSAPVIV